MTERPILFSGRLVRRILDDAKSQTRRVLNYHRDGAALAVLREGEIPRAEVAQHCCPYGQPGDRLWVRETWANLAHEGYPATPVYRADGDDVLPTGVRWRPSIHMPRWASRITLEVTGVRVERLQEISAADIAAEGFEAPMPIEVGMDGSRPVLDAIGYQENLRRAFGAGWDTINGKRPGASWSANPWVWVIEFRRLPHAASKAA